MRADENLDEFKAEIDVASHRSKKLSERAREPLDNQAELVYESVNELYIVLEEMLVAEEELRAQNEALSASRQAVEAERQRYQDLFEFAPDAYLVTDTNGKIQEANRTATELLNISHNFLLGKPLLIFIPQEARQDFRSQLNRLQQIDRIQDWKVLLQLRNGATFDADLTVGTVRDRQGKAIAYRWLLRDITERNQVEERLRLLESAVVNANDTILIAEAEAIDEPGPRILYVNAAFTSMTGYTLEEVLGKSPRFLQGANTDRRALVKIRSALKSCQPVVVELINYRKDGSEFWVELSIVPVADRTGCYTHWVAVQRDITERKQAEEERAQLIRSQAAREEAEAANRAKDEFLATISHELRTPLNAIIGWTHMIRYRQLDEAIVARAIETIDRNAKSQAKLIEDLLDISRIVQGKIRLNICSLKLLHLIEVAINSVRPAAETKGIQIDTMLEHKDILVSADPERLQQVVWNLLSNALKFTPEGGCVKVCLDYTSSDAQIQVKDTGMGISAEFVPHVFDRFRQADSTKTRSKGGLGLGLAISRHLVEMHGGTIYADSPGEGQGATFTIELPLKSIARD